ncbi:MAG: (2Fe-2S)-binding protein [Anaerolineales bacterium]|jgi:carbon-monoxide dehydrogenase small subunit
MKKFPIVLSVNHHNYELDVLPSRSLLSVIREDLGLSGTKENCLEAECGVCTVLVDGDAVNSCIYPIMHAVGKEITTIEGLTSRDGLHPIQRAFLAYDAVQCGYCIPGMIMSAVALVDEEPQLTEEDIIAGLSGNLCRCTGYAKIIEAVQAAGVEIRAEDV